ncbi:MAG: hypothetical protein QXK88_10635 [Desulfurococcaceae archaeon]
MEPIRINTKRLSTALYNAAIIEVLFGWKMDIGVSSDRLIFLDCDDKARLEDFLAFCRALCKEYKSEGLVLETKNGYHFILLRPILSTEHKRFYRMLGRKPEICDKFAIDYIHVLACIRRGYATLRISNWVLRYIIQPSGDVVERRPDKGG